MTRTRFGFTVIELLVTIAVLSVVVSMLLPSLGRARERVRRSACASNLRNLGIGYFTYGQNNNGWTPANQTSHPYSLYILYVGNSAKWYNDGILYRDGYTDTGKIFFCPSNSHRSNGEAGYEVNWWLNHEDPAAVMGWSDGNFYSRSNYSPWFSRGYGPHARITEIANSGTALNCDNINWPLYVGHNGSVPGVPDDPAAYNVLYGDGGVVFWVDQQYQIGWSELTAFWQVQSIYGWLDEGR